MFTSTDLEMYYRNLMSLGRSKPIPEVLEYLTGQNKLSTSSLIKYFDPLMKWLQEENSRTSEQIGWTEAGQNGTHWRKRRKRSLELDMPMGNFYKMK